MRKEQKAYSKKQWVKISLTWGKEIDIGIQKAQGGNKKMNPKSPQQDTLKLNCQRLKQDKNLKSIKRKVTWYIEENTIKLSDFSAEICMPEESEMLDFSRQSKAEVHHKTSLTRNAKCGSFSQNERMLIRKRKHMQE